MGCAAPTARGLGGMLAELPWQHGGSQRRIQCEPQRMQGGPAISGPCFSALTPLSHAEKGAPPADHWDYCSMLHNCAERRLCVH